MKHYTIRFASKNNIYSLGFCTLKTEYASTRHNESDGAIARRRQHATHLTLRSMIQGEFIPVCPSITLRQANGAEERSHHRAQGLSLGQARTDEQT